MYAAQEFCPMQHPKDEIQAVTHNVYAEHLPLCFMKNGMCCMAWCRADYAVALLLLGFVVTLAGQGSTYWLMSRLQRRSIVIIAMASLMLLATAVMYYESVVTFLYALHHHTLTERGHICTHRYALFAPQEDMHAILCVDAYALSPS